MKCSKCNCDYDVSGNCNCTFEINVKTDRNAVMVVSLEKDIILLEKTILDYEEDMNMKIKVMEMRDVIDGLKKRFKLDLTKEGLYERKDIEYIIEQYFFEIIG